ncbi:LysR substrate-binding domain-containing protein [Rhizobium mesoamericanum]|uniref:LysR substrate-binding domain-containing protein n=1 Tax=Rhizobium mesoamericanum TaxID=1079800 RepID=UPI00059323F9
MKSLNTATSERAVRVREAAKISGRFSASSIEAVYQACLGGLGISNLSRWYIDPSFDEGKLEHIILEDAEPEPLGIWAVYPSSRMVPPKIRLFIRAARKYTPCGRSKQRVTVCSQPGGEAEPTG